jgi:hypothetical protein
MMAEQNESGSIDLGASTTGTISVPIVTPADVLSMNGDTVTEDQIAQATSLVGLVINRDLLDKKWFDNRKPRDIALLKQAVSFQAAAAATGGSTAPIPLPSNLSSIGLGGISLSVRTLTELPTPLCTLASIAINRLSWRRRNTLRASPLILDEWVESSLARRSQQTISEDGEDDDWGPIK